MAFGHRRASECERMRSLLSAHIDDRLAPAEQHALQAHLSACPACAEELRTLRLTVSMLGRLPSVPVPRSFLLEAPAPAPAVRRFSVWYYYLRNASGAVAALLVALLAFTYLLQSGLTGMPGDANKVAVSGAPAPSAQGILGAKQRDDQTQSYVTPPQASDPTGAATGQLREGVPSVSAGGAPGVPAGAAAPTAAAQPAAAAPAMGVGTPEQDAAREASSSATAEAGAPPSWELTRDQDTGEPAAQVPEAQPVERQAWPLSDLAWVLGGLLAALVIATAVARRKAA